MYLITKWFILKAYYAKMDPCLTMLVFITFRIFAPVISASEWEEVDRFLSLTHYLFIYNFIKRSSKFWNVLYTSCYISCDPCKLCCSLSSLRVSEYSLPYQNSFFICSFTLLLFKASMCFILIKHHFYNSVLYLLGQKKIFYISLSGSTLVLLSEVLDLSIANSKN